ncbi:hypothetical protein [Velocimicrobium porci]|uniref:Uncharacterized protein n=1 Tax=Velocimicrobium porci TaxID=2606634 RepID=A0A6L5XY65_9FIRM|nr:hypothetical protein [Velocimicrobium porci]MSS63712.1 hypothetical protein [Velocimicrobium porci]
MAYIRRVAVINNKIIENIDQNITIEKNDGTIVNNVKMEVGNGYSVSFIKDNSKQYSKNIEYISTLHIKKIILQDGTIFTKLHKYNEELKKDIYYFDLKYKDILNYMGKDYCNDDIIEITYKWFTKNGNVIKTNIGRISSIRKSDFDLDISQEGFGEIIHLSSNNLIE